MPYRSLGEFIEELARTGDLLRVRAEVNPNLEVTEITDRVCKAGGPALFFESVKGHRIPVVTNLLGTEARFCRALDIGSFAEIAARIAALLRPAMPEGWMGALKLVPQLAQGIVLPPKTLKTGPCQQVVKLASDVDLLEFPALTSWPLDTSRSLHGAQVFTRNPETGGRQVGNYSLQWLDRNTASIHWPWESGGARNLARYAQKQERMPLAVTLGGDPVYVYMASAPLPADTDACLLGGFLRNRPVELVKCRTNDLEVPADVEIVLEGYIDPAESPLRESRLGGPNGFYNVPGDAPRIHLTAVTQRSNPIFPATIVAKPRQEGDTLATATERFFLPLLRLFVPEVVDYHLPAYGGGCPFVFVAIQKRYPQQACKVAAALWGLEPLMSAKVIVVLDEHVDVRQASQVWFQVGANVHPGRDVFFHQGPASSADHASPQPLVGHQMAIDATAKLPGEHPRPWPVALTMSPEIRDLVTGRWPEYELGPDPGKIW